MADLRKAREIYTGEELRNKLLIMRKRLDDPHVLSGDVVLNMLISFRDLQVFDYNQNNLVKINLPGVKN